MIPLHDIWVVLPAYNEETVICKVIETIQTCGFRRIIVIDDGSEDQTASKAESCGAMVVQHLVNRGAGASTQTGIELARMKGCQYLAFMDADGQHDPADLLKLWEKMEATQCDIVIGSRFLQTSGKIPVTRIIFNGIANTLTNVFCKGRYTDTQSGLRLLNRKAIEKLELEIDGFGYCSEMLIVAEQEQLKIEEAASTVRYSAYSISKGQDFQIGITTALNFIWNTIFK
ncbi:MAG: glycosyltransferase family 2 protein [Bacteroidota bacterium]